MEFILNALQNRISEVLVEVSNSNLQESDLAYKGMMNSFEEVLSVVSSDELKNEIEEMKAEFDKEYGYMVYNKN